MYQNPSKEMTCSSHLYITVLFTATICGGKRAVVRSGCIVIDLKNLSRLDPYSKIYVKRCDILDRRGLLLALTSHSRAKLGRMGGFQTVEGVRTFHDHRSAKHLFLFIPGVLKGTSIGDLDIRPQI